MSHIYHIIYVCVYMHICIHMRERLKYEREIYIRERKILIYFKEFSHVIARLSSLKSAEQADRLETQGRVDGAAWVQMYSRGRIFFFLDLSLFFNLQLIGQCPPTLWRATCFTQYLLI